MSKSALAAIRTQVMWNRLIAVVEEQAQSLLRCAFGTITREAGDLSAGVYDPQGRMIAQAMTGTPGHVNTMATAVAHFFKHFPQASMKPGDVYVTNDPWLGTGHLFDYVVMTPVFLGKKLVAFFASTCHVIDVGGVGMSAKANSSFEEGTLIPHMKMRKEGRLNEELIAIILANSRNPVEVRGDLLSLISANDTGARRLMAMMQEFKLTSIEPLARHILDQSEKGAREAIKALPDGEWSYEMPLDGYERPIIIKSKLTIRRGKITIDFSGSSPASIYGINSPRTYTHAYSVFGLKAVIAPHVPNNIGSLSCFDLVTEAGTCVDPIRPSPVTARHVIGQMLADAVFGCLAQALPGQVQAESAGSIWILGLNSAHGRVPAEQTANAKSFGVINIGLGGIGGRPGKDGLATTAFPSGVGTIPIEVTETQCPLYFKRKEYLADSGGAGEWRGGLSQTIEIANREAAPFTISAATFDRIRNPALGRDGGKPGRKGFARMGSGKPLPDKGIHVIETGDSLVVELPGGGGFGDPAKRSPELIEADLKAGLIGTEAARLDYGHDPPDASLALGGRIKALRKERGLSLAELARATGVSEATLSRVENEQTLVSAHHLYHLSRTLGVDITAFFDGASRAISNGIRSLCRKGEGVPLSTPRYEAQVLCTDIANKRMHPAIDTVTIRTLEEAGGFSRHDGEEFLHVLEGSLLLATEFYEPLLLSEGDSIYFDSHMGHAYLSPDGAPVRILVIATTEPPK